MSGRVGKHNEEIIALYNQGARDRKRKAGCPLEKGGKIRND